MAIATDAFTEAVAGAGSSLTWSHTCTGSNLILVVGARVSGDSSGITGATYNGVSMTRVGSELTMLDGSLMDLFYLINPATGAHNIVASYGATAFSAAGVAGSYTGAKQSGQPDSSNTGTVGGGGATSITIATTVVAANCWQILITENSNYTQSTNGGTGSTLRAGGTLVNVEDMTLCDSNGTVSTGSQSMQAVATVNTPLWGGFTLSIAPDTGGGAGTTVRRSTRALLGVGR